MEPVAHITLTDGIVSDGRPRLWAAREEGETEG